jgi:hypothetical protein
VTEIANPPTEIHIDAAGVVRFVWDDALAELMGEGAARVKRASMIRWTPAGWVSCVWGEVGDDYLGPFALYEDAIAAERAWIQAHGLSV